MKTFEFFLPSFYFSLLTNVVGVDYDLRLKNIVLYLYYTLSCNNFDHNIAYKSDV